MNSLSLPPPYRVLHFEGAFAFDAACAVAAAGVEEGALFWSERSGRVECAVASRPDRPRRETLPEIYVGALAVADALAAFAAPPAPIGFRWPNGILVDGGLVGSVSLACAAGPPEAVPAWAVIGFALALSRPGDEPGRAPDLTSISEEGFDGFSSTGLIEGFARQLLRWARRLEAEGFASIAAEWWRRAFAGPGDRRPALAGVERGTPVALDAAGNLRLRRDGREEILPLEPALSGGMRDG